MTYLAQLNKRLKKARSAKPLTIDTFVLAGYEITLATFGTECGTKSRLGTCTIDGGKYISQSELKQLMRFADE